MNNFDGQPDYSSLLTYGQSTAPLGSGMNNLYIPGLSGDMATLGGGGYGVGTVPGAFGSTGVDASKAFAGIGTDYTPLTSPSGSGGFDLGQLGTRGFWFGSKDPNGISTMGAAGPLVGALQGGANLYLGMKQYGLAKQQLAQAKDQFDKNYTAQKTLTNTTMEDRQRARVASNPGAYQSVGDYMTQHGVQ